MGRVYRKAMALLALLMSMTFCLASAYPAFAGSAPVRADGASSSPLNSTNLAKLWTSVLQTPADQNPFGSGGEQYACINLGRNTIAPFGPNGVQSCSVAPGTSTYVAASSVECSTFEGTAESQLRSCAVSGDPQTAPTVTVDGARVAVSETEAGLPHLVLPADNLFGLPAGTTGSSYAHGWVTLVRPLRPGTHTIVITVGTSTPITTTIQVK